MLQINPRELSNLLGREHDVVIIDVRLMHERDEVGYVMGSHHIPIYTPDWEENPTFIADVARIAGPDTPIVFVCRTGNRSCQACEIVQTHGYDQVYNLRDGYVGLVNLMSLADADYDDVCHLLKLPELGPSPQLSAAA